MKTRITYFVILILLISSCQSKQEGTSNAQRTDQAPSSPTLSLNEGVAMLIGTYTQDLGWVIGKAKGMHLANLKDGKVELLGTVDVGPNPSYLAVHPNKKFIYVANEVGGTTEHPKGVITALSVDGQGVIKTINSRSSLGTSPCHISVNQYGTQLLAANYGDGIIASFPIGLDGRIGRQNDEVQFSGSGDHERQDGPHAHFIKEGLNNLIFATDLGSDSIRVYKLTGGKLEKQDRFIKSEAQAGPRHLEFNDQLSIVYVLNELHGTIDVWQDEGDADQFQKLQSISTLAPNEKNQNPLSAAIKKSPDGKFLYVSNRGDINSISEFEIKEDGTLAFIESISTKGKAPRDFTISPDGKYLIVANQDSDNLVTFEIDKNSGRLQKPRITKGVMTPTCIVFL